MSKKEEVKQVIVMRKYFPDLKNSDKQKQVRTGKYVAQGAHASTAVLSEIIRKSKSSGDCVKLTVEQQLWLQNKFTKICVYVDTEEELLAIYKKALDRGLSAYLIKDAGLTEFNGEPTVTAVGIGPHFTEKFKGISDELGLF